MELPACFGLSDLDKILDSYTMSLAYRDLAGREYHRLDVTGMMYLYNPVTELYYGGL